MVESFKQRCLASLHRGGFFGLGMVVAQNVQHPMNNQQCQFIDKGLAMCVRIPLGHGWTHDNIPKKAGYVVQTGFTLRIQGKCKHISGTGLAHVFAIELRHLLMIDEVKGQLTGPNDPLHLKGSFGQCDPIVEFNR